MTNTRQNPELLEQVIQLCRQAGDAILEVYNSSSDLQVDKKADDSPVTQADLAAHRILAPGLEPLLEGVPVLSEEGDIPDFATRSQWQRYWIIDPLDGTKEFINRNGEFTVNVALIEAGEPILGVVYVPVLDITYSGVKGVGAFKTAEGSSHPIGSRSIESLQRTGQAVEVVASRNHGADEVVQLLDRIGDRLGETQTKSMGSSLKLCLVAEGAADIYPRLAPTCEWDTAAAQAVVEAAGGVVLDDQMATLRYNRKDSLLNPFFYVIGDPQYPWSELLKPTS